MNADWYEEHVEAYVDGSLRGDERRMFEEAVRSDPALNASIQASRRIKAGLHRIETPACPPEVTDAVFSRVRRDARRESAVQGLQLRWASLWKPALATLAAALLLVLLLRPASEPPPPAYAEAEVTAALEEVKWTLAYLNQVGSRTGETIREEVFADGVVRPIERGLGLDEARSGPN